MKMLRDITGAETPEQKQRREQRNKATEFFKKACRDLSVAMDKKTVLLVDDNPVDAHAMLKMLNGAKPAGGPEILTVTSADAAMSFIEANGDDVRVVVTDMYMQDDPEAGMDLVEWVKRNHSQIPVLVCTAHADIGEKVQKKFPDVQVLLKGNFTIPQLLLLLGMQPANCETA